MKQPEDIQFDEANIYETNFHEEAYQEYWWLNEDQREIVNYILSLIGIDNPSETTGKFCPFDLDKIFS